MVKICERTHEIMLTIKRIKTQQVQTLIVSITNSKPSIKCPTQIAVLTICHHNYPSSLTIVGKFNTNKTTECSNGRVIKKKSINNISKQFLKLIK